MAPPFSYQPQNANDAMAGLGSGLGPLPPSGIENVEFQQPSPRASPRALEVYPSIGRPSLGGPRLSEVFAGKGGGAGASSPEIPLPKLLGGGQGRRETPYAGSFKGYMSHTGPIKVAKGDTLSKIAKRYDVSILDLMKANPQIVDPNRIMAGAMLQVPDNAPGLAGPAAEDESGLYVNGRRFRLSPGSIFPQGHILSAFDRGEDVEPMLNEYDQYIERHRERPSAPPPMTPSPRPFTATADMRGEGYRLGQSIRDQIKGMFGPTIEPMPGNPNYGRQGKAPIR